MTDVAVITTTINVPTVLKRYADAPQAPLIIVAGDVSTPSEAEDFVSKLPNGRYLRPDQQKRWACSDVIGWRSIQRRNVAVLEAARLGAEVIVTVDDDNDPLNPQDYLTDHLANLELKASMEFPYVSPQRPSLVFDPGSLLSYDRDNGMPVMARGLPRTQGSRDGVVGTTGLFVRGAASHWRVGCSAGLWLGDPDVDAVDRMAYAPTAMRMLRAVMLAPGARAPINTQNTAWRAELGACVAVLPGVGRYDDIWGGYMGQTVAGALGFGVVFGDPLVRQDRNDHHLAVDVEKEIFGYKNTRGFIDALNEVSFDPELTDASAHDLLDKVTDAVQHMLPDQAVQFLRHWVDDWDSLR